MGAVSLKQQDVKILKDNIAVKLCNIEKIFSPSFFDVMEHLPVHLPDEAVLGGPVQYRWMYPFERYMYHLKKKVKNRAHIGGSIVAQCLTEEISTATTNFFNMSLGSDNPTEIGVDLFTYSSPDVPSIFKHRGRISGKSSTGWLTDEEYNVLQNFLLINCPQLTDYERIFEELITTNNADLSTDEQQLLKDKHFATWIKEYIIQSGESTTVPMWLRDFIEGPRRVYTSWPSYFTRSYQFKTMTRGQNKKTQNYGVCVRGTTETEYFGKIEDIRMIEYDGPVGLKVMIFKCFWYDNRVGRGIRKHRSGLVDVASRRRYAKYDPFSLPDQCDHTSFIPYPRTSSRASADWLACTKVMPRGVRNLSDQIIEPALQDDTHNDIVAPSGLLRVDSHIVEDNSDYEDLPGEGTNDLYVSEDEFMANDEPEYDSTSDED